MVVNPVVSDFRTQGFINIRAVNVTSCLLVVLIVFGNDILLVINIICYLGISRLYEQINRKVVSFQCLGYSPAEMIIGKAYFFNLVSSLNGYICQSVFIILDVSGN
jgi:hypothetical protein